MHTVVETAEFQKQAKAVWSDTEREAFIDWISANPDAGDVIPGADGARKVRWSRPGMGKRGGVRVIYFHLTAEEIVRKLGASDVMLFARGPISTRRGSALAGIACEGWETAPPITERSKLRRSR